MEKSDFEAESEIVKELELEKEKEQLEYTREIIKEEILNYINKRKDIGEYILEYRKNLLDEYRDDEDKIIEYFDHEKFVKEEAFKTIDRRLKEMLILENSPYFGRVDFVEEEEEKDETIYVGRFGITPEKSYEPLIVDWRAPVSALFYSGKLGSVKYKAPMGEIETNILSKRQYIIKRGKLMGMFDSVLDVKDDILQMVLSKNSSEKLKDVIMTIQEEQDNIIRQPYNKNIIVNGIAGSGKTTIALHRVAYLLYNYRDKLQDKVLILGPNGIFMEYISMVLPSLGEVGVKQTTFKDYAMSLLDIDEIMSFKEYMEKILNKDLEFIDNIILKNSDNFIEVLDNYIEDADKNYFKYKDVYLMDSIVITKEEISELFNKYYIDMPLFRRSKKIRRIIFNRIKDVRDEKVRAIEKEFVNIKNSMTPKELEDNLGHIEFLRKNKIREVVKEVLKTKDGIHWIENPSIFDIYNNLNSNKVLTYDDLAPLLYLNIKLKGRGKTEEIKHVVIDEAQDYNLLQFKVIKELTGCLSLTIVGDVNQRLIPYEGTIPMLKLDMVEQYNLNKSYRSTKEIIEHANKYLDNNDIVPLVRSGSEVSVKQCNDYEDVGIAVKEFVKLMKDRGCDSIAIICKNEEVLKYMAQNISKDVVYRIMDDEDIVYSGGTILIPSYYAKGLEFDGVIFIEDREDNNANYVMSTRALHELAVLKLR